MVIPGQRYGPDPIHDFIERFRRNPFVPGTEPPLQTLVFQVGVTVPHPKTRSATPDDLDTAAMLGQRLKLSRGLLNPTGLREPGKEDARYWFANHHPIVEPYTWQDILWLQLDASSLLD